MSFTNKFCVNCENYSKFGQCGSSGSIRHLDPVTGGTLYESAVAMRANPNMCAEEGKWFMPKLKNEVRFLGFKLW